MHVETQGPLQTRGVGGSTPRTEATGKGHPRDGVSVDVATAGVLIGTRRALTAEAQDGRAVLRVRRRRDRRLTRHLLLGVDPPTPLRRLGRRRGLHDDGVGAHLAWLQRVGLPTHCSLIST